MEKKAVSGTLLTLFLIGQLTLAFNIQPVKTEPRAMHACTVGANKFQNQSLSHTINIDVVFVGYSQELIDTPTIDSAINKYYQLDYSDSVISYIFDLQYFFANLTYYQSLRSFILENSVNGTDTTSRLNETALEIQKDTGTRMSIFLPQSGRAINATAVEEWFSLNPYVSTNHPGYSFYVLNFTDLGSKHWYNLTEYDLEANSIRDFWRLEWDNRLNPNVRFPYSGFSSKRRIFYIDPSAFQWYLTWARMWWGLSVNGPKYEYYYQDLGNFLSSHDITTYEGQWALAQYLAGWIDDLLGNLIAPCFISLPPLVTSMSLQILILNNASQFGYTNEKMSWIIDKGLVEKAVSDLLPYTRFRVSVNFEDLTDYPYINSILNDAIISRQNNWTYIDGLKLFLDLYSVREQYFNFTEAELVVNSYVFLLKNASMIYWGKEFTGLGGMNQTFVLKSVDRYFRPDGLTPKSGLGTTMIHEVGHCLGFDHTFQLAKTHAGDFIHDVMGYYPHCYSFSKIRTDVMRRTIVDMKLLDLLDALVQDEYSYSQRNPSEVIDSMLDEAKAKINQTLQLYDQMRYLNAYYTIIEAEKVEAELRTVISKMLVDLNGDGEVDIRDITIVAMAFGSKPGDENWDPIADLNEDETIDIKDITIVAMDFGKTL